MEKRKWAFIAISLQIFWQSFKETFLELSSSNHMKFVQTIELDCLPLLSCQQKCYICEKKKKKKNNNNKNNSSPQKPQGGWSWIFVEILASAKIVFLLPLLMCFRRYGNLKFPLTYNGKSEK